MSLVPTELGIDILVALSTGLFLLLVMATLLVRISWGVLVRNTDRPRPTIGKSFLVAVAGGVLVLPIFLLLDVSASKPEEKKVLKADRSFRITDEEDRARRTGIKSLRNHLRMLEHGKQAPKRTSGLPLYRNRNVWMISYASGGAISLITFIFRFEYY